LFCEECGTAFSDFSRRGEHTNRYGNKCRGKFIGPFQLGHTFITDIILMELRIDRDGGPALLDETDALSVLLGPSVTVI